MRNPIPRNRLVVLTLLGAVLTGVVAVGLAVPGLGLQQTDPGTVDAGAQATLPSDAPTPNENFTPAVQQTGGGGEHEEEEHEDEHEDEHDGYEEDD